MSRNMTHEEIQKFIVKSERLTKWICVSPELAREYLVKWGFCNPDGTLHKDYCDE